MSHCEVHYDNSGVIVEGRRLLASDQEVIAKLENTVDIAIHRLNEERERYPCLGKVEDLNGYKMLQAPRRLILDVLMACWGLGTWLGVNGIYMQLPLLVQRLPEGWMLPAYMALSIQLANVGLLIYALLRRIWPKASDAPYIYGLLTVGTLALFLNAFLYTRTVHIGGNEISFTFLTLTFFAALVGCTSSVLFYPYLRHYRDVYLVTYLVGEGLSGFIPSILALVQGVGGEPDCVLSADNSTVLAIYPPARFNTMVFFIILSALSLLSLVSFLSLNNCSVFDSERVSQAATVKNEEATIEPIVLLSARWISVLIMMGVLNALMNGAMPSIQSYSCMPYGTEAYHLAVTLGAMANPSACLAGVWLKPVSARVLGGMLTFASIAFCYILTTALLSPTPPLQHQAIGVVLVVTAWVVVSALVSYARMWVYGWARTGGVRGMRACGASTQIGSALGSLLFYILVSHIQLFKSQTACPSHL